MLISSITSTSVHKNQTDLDQYSKRGHDDTLHVLVSRLARTITYMLILNLQRDHRYESMVQLKVGQRVVLQQNLAPSLGLVNGTQGTILEFVPNYNPLKERISKYRADIVMKLGPSSSEVKPTDYCQQQIDMFVKENGHHSWPLVRFDNGQEKIIFADCMCNAVGIGSPYSVLSRTQIPLMAGYAITIHKCQVCTYPSST